MSTYVGITMKKIKEELRKVKDGAENQAAGASNFTEGMISGLQLAISIVDREIKKDLDCQILGPKEQ